MSVEPVPEIGTEAVGVEKIQQRLLAIEQESARVIADIDSCDRERDALFQKNRNLVAEHNRLTAKLMLHEDNQGDDD